MKAARMSEREELAAVIWRAMQDAMSADAIRMDEAFKHADHYLAESASACRATTMEVLAAMLESDPSLYERVLDTPMFAYHFNKLCDLARRVERAR